MRALLCGLESSDWQTMARNHRDRIRPVASLQEFFKDSVEQAMERNRVDADDHTAYYVVNLLTLFARSETLFDKGGSGSGLQPLALLLADAAAADDVQVRNFLLQRVGDTSLGNR